MTFCGGTKPFKQPGPLCESCWELPQADLDAACDAFFGRASAQREGGFAVGQRVRVSEASGYSFAPCEATVVAVYPGTGAAVDHGDGKRWNVRFEQIEPVESVDPANANFAALDMENTSAQIRENAPAWSPQPAPMTRAARVLSGMMADPYKEIVKGPPAAEANRRQEAARLRMAKWSLDRPLDAERARWERLVGPVHPVTGRPVKR